jgi:hypothetical protein
MVDLELNDFGADVVAHYACSDGLRITVSRRAEGEQPKVIRVFIPTQMLLEQYNLCCLRAAVEAGELLPPVPEAPHPTQSLFDPLTGEIPDLPKNDRTE